MFQSSSSSSSSSSLFLVTFELSKKKKGYVATIMFQRKWKGKRGKNEQKKKKWNVLEEVVGKKGKEGEKKSGTLWRKW